MDQVDPVFIVESTPNGPVVHKFFGEIKVLEKEDAKKFTAGDKSILSKYFTAYRFEPPKAIPADITYEELRKIKMKRQSEEKWEVKIDPKIMGTDPV